MNFLELCQFVARESGTFTSNLPTTVANQTGRLGKVVWWTAEAWRRIQNQHTTWLFLRKELPASAITTAGAARYTAASWGITDFGEWLLEPNTITIYKQSLGREDEGVITPVQDFTEWRTRYDRGVPNQNRPIACSVSPAGEFCFGPVPDDTYVVRGFYRRSPQSLVNDTDVPISPERFHHVIAWRALLMLAQHDEAVNASTRASMEYAAGMSEMTMDQLPAMPGVAAYPLA